MKQKHQHDAQVTIDGLIRCISCGEILPESEKEVASFSSRRMLKSTLEEIAVAGNYIASSFNDGFIVYIKTQGHVKEEVMGKQKTKRVFVICKRLSTI